VRIDRIVGSSPHPGDVLKEELESRGWTHRDLAFVLGMSEQQLSPILSGKRKVSPDMARLLGDALEVSPRFFLNLQSAYDLEHAKPPGSGVAMRGRIQSELPLREMMNRGWIEEADADLLEIQVSQFMALAGDNDNSLQSAFAAKKTHYDEVSPSQRAWVACARKLAAKIDAPDFDEEKLRLALPKLKTLLVEPESISEVSTILRECGVRLVVVETLPGAKIDGACFWLSESKPVIVLSTLHDRLDNFWFVLRHEIEHVLRGDGKGSPHVDENVAQQVERGLPECEQIANKEAANFLIEDKRFLSFFHRKNPYFSERDILGFAAVLGVHPAIVVGRLQNKLQKYNFLRKHLVKIRPYLLSSVEYDGWGHSSLD
jgi:HTH-type transcriptional regulator/antitoxin HigA